MGAGAVARKSRVEVTIGDDLRERGSFGDLEEDDDFGAAGDPNGGGGDLVTVMSNIVTIDNGNGANGGLKIREKETGNLDVTLTNILSVNNFGSGIFARESSTGNSIVTIKRALVSGNKISDLGPVAHSLTFGGPPECPERPFSLAELRAVSAVLPLPSRDVIAAALASGEDRRRGWRRPTRTLPGASWWPSPTTDGCNPRRTSPPWCAAR